MRIGTESFIHWNFDPVLFSIGDFGIRYYSLCWVIGFILGYLVIRQKFRKDQMDFSLLEPLLLYVILGALIGARLGHCFFYDWNYFSHHLLEIILPISITQSGVRFTGYASLASHGGAIGLILCLLLFSKKYHVPLLNLLDYLAFAAPLAGAFIRIGNFFNSEILGAPTGTGWGVIFDRVDMIPRHPAQLYEALAYLISFLVLIYYIKHRKKLKQGTLFGLSIVLIFLSRFIIEFFKEVQEPFEVGLRETIGLDMGQLLSVPFIIVGIYFLFRKDRMATP